MVEISVNRKSTLVALLLSIFLLLALLLRVGIALAFPNLLHADEIFQSIEQAHRLIYGYGSIPWEFRRGTRSWVLPEVLAGIMRLTAWMGEGSSGYLAGITIFLCLISLIPVAVAFLWGYRTGGLLTAVITGGICSIWFELIYFAPKAFNEVVAAHLLLPGLYLGVHGKWFQPRTRLFLVGLCFGAAVAFRIHLLPAVAVAIWFICRKDWSNKGIPMIGGIVCPLLVFGLVDAFTWSYPFQSFWQNIWVNVGEGKSNQYGAYPWYAYLKLPINNWSFAMVPIGLLIVVGARRSPILAWVATTIVLSHSLIAHKEYRFLYPAVLIAIILAGLGTAELINRWRPRRMVMVALICLVLWTATSVGLASRFDTSRKPNLSMLWAGAQTTNWQRYSGNLLALQKLSTDPTVCGVGFLGVNLYDSGGYTYLHRNVPIFIVELLMNEQKTNFDGVAPSFNYLMSAVPVPPHQDSYALQQCWGSTCLYKRAGSCTQIPGYHINRVLEQLGQ